MLLFLFLSFKELVCCSACIAWTVGAASGLAQALAQAAGTLYQRPVRSSEQRGEAGWQCVRGGGGGVWCMDSQHRVAPHRAKIGAALFPDFRGVRISEGITGAIVCSRAGEMRSNLGLKENCFVFLGGGGSSKLRVARCKNAIRCSICGKRRRASAC